MTTTVTEVASDDPRVGEVGLDGAGLLRCAAGATSLGAALVAVAAAAPSMRAGVPAGVMVIALAAWQAGWGLTALAAGRLPAVRSASAVAGVAVLAWALTAVVAGAGTQLPSPASVGAGALAASMAATLSALSLLAAQASVRALRRAGDAPARPLARGVQFAALYGTALVVSSLATPGMAATETGRGAPEHFEHMTSGDGPTAPAPSGSMPPGHH